MPPAWQYDDMNRPRDLAIVLAIVIPGGVLFAVMLGFISGKWLGAVAGTVGALIGVTALLIWKYRNRPPVG